MVIISRTGISFICLFLFYLPCLFSQGKAAFSPNNLKIPVEFQAEHLRPGNKISLSVKNSESAFACTGAGNQSVGGFLQCADQTMATLNTDRNDFWNCCAPATWSPSEAYEYNFPTVESAYPCVAGTIVDELIITVTINAVTFNLGSPFACCADYFEGVYANLYDDCTGACAVAGDGLVNNGNPATGDCAPNGDHLVYDIPTSSFPLGLPFVSTTTCLAGVVGTGDALGVDIVPSFFYQNATAAGCACPSDLISQGLVSIDYDIEVEYVFCSNNLPTGCFPAAFDPIGPLCETATAEVLPTTSTNGVSGTWNPASINPTGQGGNTIVAVFTPNPGQCVGGTAELEVEIQAATLPAFDAIGPLCESEAPVPLPSVSNNGVAGTWDVGTTFDPNGQGGNTVTLNFTPDAGECASATTLDIVVNSATTPTFTNIGPVCENAAPVALPSSSTNGVSGTWDVGTTFDPSGQGGNTVTITFTPGTGECANIATMDVTVESETVPSFDPIGPICENEMPVPLPAVSNNGIAGTWDVGTTFDPSGQGGNTVTINFTPNAGECAAMGSLNIAVELESTPVFDPIGPICENAPPVNLPAVSNNGIAGTWDVGTTFAPTGQGGNTVTVNFTPNAGECGSPTSLNIIVVDEIVPTFTNIGPLCEAESPVVLPTISDNGISGTWDVGPTFNPFGQGGNIVTISFNPDVGQCASLGSMNIAVNMTDTPSFSPLGPVCESDPPLPLPSTSLNGISGTWDVGPTFNPSGQGGSTVTITFTPAPNECASVETMDIVVEMGAVPIFSPIGPLCENENPVLLPGTSLNSFSGTWDVGPTFDPSGQGGNNITITFTPSAGQCAVASDLTISVTSEDTPTFSPIGPFCEDDTPFVLPTQSLEGVSGTWDVGANFDPAGLGGTTPDIVFTPDPGVCYESATLSVEVNSLPQNDINDVSCNLSLSDYFVDFQTDGDVVSSSAGTVIDNGSGSFTIDNIPEGTDVTITVSNSNTNCESEFMVTSPSCSCPNIDPPVGNNVEICEGETIPTLTVTVGVGFEVDWYDAAAGGTLLLQNSTTYTPTAAGTYFAETVDPLSNCTSNTRTGIELIIFPVDTTFVQDSTCNVMQVGMDTTVFATATCDSVVITTTTLIQGEEIFQTATSCDPSDVGTDTLFLTTQLGCDSLIITSTTLSPADTSFATATTCDPMQVGLDTTIFATATCDSVVITTFSLLPPDVFMQNATTCNLSEVGMDTLFLSNQLGCDSLIITNTTFDPLPPTNLMATSCNPMEVGLDTVIFNSGGCDSLVITNTTLVPGDEVFVNATSCDPAEVGTDSLLLTNQSGCDSLVITMTTLSDADTTFQTAASCDPTQVGVDTLVFTTATCDSIVITTTSLLMGDVVNLQATSCDLNDVGLDTLVLSNQAGCDSLVITETTFEGIIPTFLQASSCDPMAVGLDTMVFNSGGCDSLVITNTTLLPFSETFLAESSCDPMSVGVDTVTLMAFNGCDSLVITTTSFSASDTTFTQATTCDPLLVGMDTVVFNTPTCDSIVINTTDLAPTDVSMLMDSTCDPAMAGIDTVFLTNQFGCDSLVITEVALLPSDEVTFDLPTCVQSEVGIDTLVLTNQNGCDSLVITNTFFSGGIDEAVVLAIDPTCLEPFGSITIDSVDGGTPPYQYSIDGGSTLGADSVFVQLLEGEYDIVIEDANGCTFELTEELFAEIPPSVSLDPNELTISLGDEVNLSPVVIGQLAEAIWTPATFLDCTDCLTPTSSPTENIDYAITIIDENGCEASATVSIFVDQRIQVYLPDAFSPNGDGINDMFTVQGDENQILEVDELLIFDRWGGLVFENYQIPVNDFSFGWDGTRDGEGLGAGVYVYYAMITMSNGEKIKVEGGVTLIR